MSVNDPNIERDATLHRMQQAVPELCASCRQDLGATEQVKMLERVVRGQSQQIIHERESIAEAWNKLAVTTEQRVAVELRLLAVTRSLHRHKIAAFLLAAWGLGTLALLLIR